MARQRVSFSTTVNGVILGAVGYQALISSYISTLMVNQGLEAPYSESVNAFQSSPTSISIEGWVEGETS